MHVKILDRPLQYLDGSCRIGTPILEFKISKSDSAIAAEAKFHSHFHSYDVMKIFPLNWEKEKQGGGKSNFHYNIKTSQNLVSLW